MPDSLILKHEFSLSDWPVVSAVKKGTAPSVFISYSHCSKEHKEWVGFLCRKLSQLDIEVNYDGNVDGSQTFCDFMKSINANDFVICVLSASYVEKVKKGAPCGVVDEFNFIKEKSDKVPLEKFVIPIFKNSLSGEFKDKIPDLFEDIKCYDFDNKKECMKSFAMIACRIMAIDKMFQKMLDSANKHCNNKITMQSISDWVHVILANYWNAPLNSTMENKLRETILSGEIWKFICPEDMMQNPINASIQEKYNEMEINLIGKWDLSYSGDREILKLLAYRPDNG